MPGRWPEGRVRPPGYEARLRTLHALLPRPSVTAMATALGVPRPTVGNDRRRLGLVGPVAAANAAEVDARCRRLRAALADGLSLTRAAARVGVSPQLAQWTLRRGLPHENIQSDAKGCLQLHDLPL